MKMKDSELSMPKRIARCEKAVEVLLATATHFNDQFRREIQNASTALEVAITTRHQRIVTEALQDMMDMIIETEKDIAGSDLDLMVMRAHRDIVDEEQIFLAQAEHKSAETK